MILERTLPAVWRLSTVDVPALEHRQRAVVVDDVEQLCAAIVVDQSRRDAPYVPRELSDLHEALAFLLGRVVEVLPVYDPSRGRQVHDPVAGGFKGWLHLELTMDLIDHWRSWNGRHGQKRVADTRVIDRIEEEANGRADDGVDGRSAGERRSRGALDEGAGDRGDSWLDALRGRLLEGRDRALLREVASLGLSETRGARGGAARPGRGRQAQPDRVAA